MAEGEGSGLRKKQRSIAAPSAFWRLIAGPGPGLTLAPGGIGGNALRFPAVESVGIIPVVAIEEWRADATQLVAVAKAVTARLAGVNVTAHATAGEAAHVAPCKAATSRAASAPAAKATAAASASKRIIGDARASEGQSGDEGHNLLQSELLHHDCLSVRYKWTQQTITGPQACVPVGTCQGSRESSAGRLALSCCHSP
jgi:hypothetical protein